MTDKVQIISEESQKKLQEIVNKYPNSKSAIMPALYLAQEELGWLSDSAFNWVSTQLDLPLAHVKEVASFYTMYYKKPVGTYHIQVCRTLSCMICGAFDILSFLKEKFKVNQGEITLDGMWSYEAVECLGSCGTAPMAQINDVFFEKLTVSSLEKILDQIATEKPNLRFSTLKGELSKGLINQPRSQVWNKDIFDVIDGNNSKE